MKQADFIIAGMGAAGLSLTYHILQNAKLKDKKILLIDKEKKDKNDRTWCFWAKDEDVHFHECIAKTWSKLALRTPEKNLELDLAGFRYHLIRGEDFYSKMLSMFESFPNVEIRYEPIQSVYSENGQAYVATERGSYSADYAFSSLFQKPKALELRNNVYLLQHFVGWKIKTSKPVFDPESPDFMDFRTMQLGHPTFFYVLPYAADEALVEYTLFSPEPLPAEQYTMALKAYIEARFGGVEYEIIETEQGAIPMTDYRFPASDGQSVVYVGSAGGISKATSGYTFFRIQKHSKAIVNCLEKGIDPARASLYSSWKMQQDTLMLKLMLNEGDNIWKIFQQLFENNPIERALNFLNEETSMAEDLLVMSSVPSMPFIRAIGMGNKKGK